MMTELTCQIDVKGFLKHHAEDLQKVIDSAYGKPGNKGDLETMHAALQRLKGVQASIEILVRSMN